MNEMDLKYKHDDSIVVFIDVLGSSEQIKKYPEEALNAIHDAYDDALEAFRIILKNVEVPPKIRIFSDNIVISCACTDGTFNLYLYIIVVLCAVFQENLLKYNILVRGGITRGDFFSDDIMIWGKALVDAYELERAIAIYPRIVIHPQVILESGVFANRGEAVDKDILPWIHQDQDGLYYVDYLNTNLLKKPSSLLDAYLRDNEVRLRIYKDNLRIIQKIEWHANYLNRKLFEIESLSNNNVHNELHE